MAGWRLSAAVAVPATEDPVHLPILQRSQYANVPTQAPVHIFRSFLQLSTEELVHPLYLTLPKISKNIFV